MALTIFSSPTHPKTSPFCHLSSTNLSFASHFTSVRTSTPPAQLPRQLGSVRVGAVASLQDAGATVFCLAGAYSLVVVFDKLAERNILEKKISRKAVHVLSGILYMSAWPLYSSSPEARYIAAIVPLLNCIRLLTYGLRIITNEGLIQSITREGNPDELLRGPLYYVLVLLVSVLAFWRESPVGILSVAMMCGGDGFADIIGRRYGVLKLPYNRHKSWIGSISMFIFGFLFSIGMIYYFSTFGYIHLNWESTIKKVAMVALAATLVESLPITEIIDDNLSVPLVSMLMAFLLF